MKLITSKTKHKQIGDDKFLYLPLSFFLPFVILFVAVIVMEIVPFGMHSFAISDGQLYVQGLPFFSRLLHGQENMFYSFKNGLGGNEWSILSWGGLSPTLLLTYFATQETMPAFFTWIVLVNMSLCGLTMYLLLADVRGHRLDNLLFSTSYALMGFNAAFCYHYIFFIGPQSLPLMVLGLRRLLRGKSPLLYILSLGACIFMNFYFGFMLCVASVALLCAHWYADPAACRGKKGLWFASSVVAGLLAAPMWLPAIKAFTGGGRIDQAFLFDFSFAENMPFIQIFSKLFSGANSQLEQVNGLPYIFCGILVVALVVLYFMDAGIPLRRKKAAGGLIAFYLLSFYISAFTRLMHGGTHTNWFNYRYSFIFSFLLIALAAEEWARLPQITLRDTKRCGVALLLATILVFSTRYEYITGGSVVLDFALLLLMWVCFALYKKHPRKFTEKALSGALILVVSVNLFANFTMTIRAMRDWEIDLTLYQANVLFSGSSVDAIKKVESGFFRMEKDVSESGTCGIDPALYGYNGVSHSGPADRMFIHQELGKLGVNWFDMRHWYQAGAPAATDALLGLKYILASRDDIGEEKGYPKIVSTEENAVYQNPNALSVAILADDKYEPLSLSNNAFKNLNGVWQDMTSGRENIFTLVEDITFSLHNPTDERTVTSEEIKVSQARFEAQKEDTTPKTAYVEAEFVAERAGAIYRFDCSVPMSGGGNPNPAIKYCGRYDAGETVKDIAASDANYATRDDLLSYCSNIVYAYADDDVLKEYAEILNARDITFNVEAETRLTGTFTASGKQRLVFTMPWDEGWTCRIDGKKVPIEKMWGVFMGVKAPEGQHSYEMTFFPAWMNYGLYLCGLACMGFVAVMALWRRKSKVSAIVADVSEEQDAAPSDEEGDAKTSDIPDDVQTSDVPDAAQTSDDIPDDVQTSDVPDGIEKDTP